MRVIGGKTFLQASSLSTSEQLKQMGSLYITGLFAF